MLLVSNLKDLIDLINILVIVLVSLVFDYCLIIMLDSFKRISMKKKRKV